MACDVVHDSPLMSVGYVIENGYLFIVDENDRAPPTLVQTQLGVVLVEGPGVFVNIAVNMTCAPSTLNTPGPAQSSSPLISVIGGWGLSLVPRRVQSSPVPVI